MDYSSLANIYEKLEQTPSKLEKTRIISDMIKKIPTNQLEKVILLMLGTVFPGHSQLDLGVADKMIIKSIMKSTGYNENSIINKFKETGDLGIVTKECLKSSKQMILGKKKLDVDFVFEKLEKLAKIIGNGSQNKKMDIISEMIVFSSPKEACYIVRTILGNLRTGASEGLLRDSISKAFFLEEEKKDAKNAVDYALNIIADFGKVAKIAKLSGMSGLRKVDIEIGKPINVMLAEKAESIEKVLKKYDKIIAEWKFDGMRAQIHKKGNNVWIYTRRLENVTLQFPDIVELVKKSINIDCVVEGEVVGINSKTGNTLPFQILSQRIHRKYDIEKIANEIPIQLNLFDIIYLDGKNLINETLINRRKKLEKIIKPINGKIQLTKKIISKDINEIQNFYKSALEANQEGIMLKVLDSTYNFGRHVDGWIKIKPIMESLDLIIVGAVWGEGSRTNMLTSFKLGCKNGDDIIECGMMSTGFTEKEFNYITKKLIPLIIDTKGKNIKVKPEIVVEINYQEIQKSPNYSSGFALRFPSFKNIRLDKGLSDIDTLNRIKKLYDSQGHSG